MPPGASRAQPTAVHNDVVIRERDDCAPGRLNAMVEGE